MQSLFVWFVAFTSALGGLLFGYEIGIINTVLSMNPFQLYFGTGMLDSVTGEVVPSPLKRDVDGWIVAIFTIGCIFGSMLVSWAADRLGRKRCILLGSLLFTLGGFLQAIATSLSFIYGGRVVSGFAIGILSSTVPLYISEVAPTEVRGRLIAVQQLMITIGIFLSACINSILYYYVDGDAKWRISLAIQCVPGALLLCMMSFLPFSPRWLITQDRDSEAILTVAKLRAESLQSMTVVQEYEDMKSNIEFERSIGKASWSEMLKPGIRNRFVMANLLQAFQQLTGINVVMYYSSQIYEAAGFEKAFAATTLVILNNLINFLGTFPGMYFIERAGRKKLLIVGAFVMGLCHISVSIFSGMAVSENKNTTAAYGALISFYVFTVAFASSWGPTAWVVQSEIFSIRLRAKGSSAATTTNWLMNALIGKCYPLLFESLRNYTYLIYAGFCFVMMFYAMTIPETKGKTLEEMDDIFYKNVDPKHRPVRSEKERELEERTVVIAGGH